MINYQIRASENFGNFVEGGCPIGSGPNCTPLSLGTPILGDKRTILWLTFNQQFVIFVANFQFTKLTIFMIKILTLQKIVNINHKCCKHSFG